MDSSEINKTLGIEGISSEENKSETIDPNRCDNESEVTNRIINPLIASVGVVSTFLPWLVWAKTDHSTNALDDDLGILYIALFGIPLVMSLLGDIKPKIITTLGMLIPASIALIMGFVQISSFNKYIASSQILGNITPDFVIGIGLYIYVLAAVMLVIVSIIQNKK